MGPPTLFMRIRQTLGRALRETGQAIDRLGIRTEQLLLTKRVVGDDPFIYDDITLSRHRNIYPMLKYGEPLISPNVTYIAPCSTLIGSVRIGSNSTIWYGVILRADRCNNGSSFNDHYPTLFDSFVENNININNVLQKGGGEKTTNDDDDDDNNNNNDKAIIMQEVSSSSEAVLEHPILDKQRKKIFDLDPERLHIGQTYHDNYNKKEDKQIPTIPTGDILTGGGIYIGDNSHIQDGCIITSKYDHSIIGNHTNIGSKSQLHSSNVGNYCTVGTGCLIREFVTINDMCIIESGSVISMNTNIPSGELWSGNPAKKIRNLTQEEKDQLIMQQNNKQTQLGKSQKNVMKLGGNLGLVSSSSSSDDDTGSGGEKHDPRLLALFSRDGINDQEGEDGQLLQLEESSDYIQRRREVFQQKQIQKKKQTIQKLRKKRMMSR